MATGGRAAGDTMDDAASLIAALSVARHPASLSHPETSPQHPKLASHTLRPSAHFCGAAPTNFAGTEMGIHCAGA